MPRLMTLNAWPERNPGWTLIRVPIDQDLGSPLRDEFYSKVTHRTPALVKAHWARLIFTGRGQPPAEVDGNAAMRRMIAENPGMIGYVERTALDPSVRAVLIVR